MLLADPAVVAGRFDVTVAPWMVPGGAMTFSATTFPRSMADTEEPGPAFASVTGRSGSVTTSGRGSVDKRIHYRATFAVLATAALAFSLLQSLIIPAIPLLEHTLHTTTTGATWLLTGYLLSAAIATPILGRIGDMVGKEKMIVLVLITLSVGTLISALATTSRSCWSDGSSRAPGGAVFPLAFGIIRDEFPPEKVAGAIGVLSAILGVGVGAGIVLAGPIIEHLSYHWLFWVPLVLSIGATVTTFLFVPESPVRSPGRVNWVGASIMSAWLVTGLLAVSYGPIWGWKSPRCSGSSPPPPS